MKTQQRKRKQPAKLPEIDGILVHCAHADLVPVDDVTPSLRRQGGNVA